MTDEESLFLHEEVLLLALKDEEGTIVSGSMYNFAAGGAMLAELLIRQRVRVHRKGKKGLVELISPEPVGDPLIDECLSKVAASGKRRSAEDWVQRFANAKDLKHRLARQLCRRGILRDDEEKVLLLFTRKVYPEIDPVPERAVIDRLREAIFTDIAEVDARTVVLVALAHHAHLLPVVFDRRDVKQRKARIEQVINGDATGKATKEAIEAMETAVMVAVMTPIMMSTMTGR